MARVYGSDVNIIFRELVKIKPDMILTYSRMSKLVDLKIEGSSNYVLTMARKRAKEEKGIIFRAVNKVGLQRLDDHNTVRAARAYIESANKAANAAKDVLRCIKKFDKLSHSDAARFNATLSVSSMIRELCDARSFDAIEDGFASKKKIERLDVAVA